MTDRELLEVMFKKMEQMDANIDAKLERIESKLDGLTQQVVKNSEDLAFVKEQTATNSEKITETNDIMKELKQIERKQEQTIDLLSRRSIDQEAELRRLKQ